MVPIGLLVSAAAMYGLHLVGLHSSYFSNVLPYQLVLGIGSGLSTSPSFSTGTLGLASQDAGVGSATLNTAQQVGGSIGTALLNTVAAGAAASYLVGRTVSPANIQVSLVHSYTAVFLYCAFFFVIAAIVAAMVFQRGDLKSLVPEYQTASVDARSEGATRDNVYRVRAACR